MSKKSQSGGIMCYTDISNIPDGLKSMLMGFWCIVLSISMVAKMVPLGTNEVVSYTTRRAEGIWTEYRIHEAVIQLWLFQCLRQWDLDYLNCVFWKLSRRWLVRAPGISSCGYNLVGPIKILSDMLLWDVNIKVGRA